jgi:phosphatidylglycerophosphatase C
VYSLLRPVPSVADSSRPVVAAFDLDGTLTTRDCVTPFLRRIAGRALARRVVTQPLAVATAAARRDRDRLKELATQALAGLDAAAVGREGAAFAREVRAAWLRADTLARLQTHQALNHATVIVSASYEAYVVPLGALLGVDGVLCTRLERDDAGRLTGRLDGPNCRGPEKVSRLRAWLADRGLDDAVLWAYGDSEGDRELLAMAAHPVWVQGVRIGPEAEPCRGGV